MGSHGRGPLGAQRDPMGGDPRERDPLGAQEIPWEGIFGAPIGSPCKVFCDEVTFKKSGKSSFLMFSKTRSGETSREKIRMVRALLLDTPKPLIFKLNLSFLDFLLYFHFSSFYRIFCPVDPFLPYWTQLDSSWL